MDNITFYGIDNSYIPLSTAFLIDILNCEINLTSFNEITKVSLSIESKLFNTFTIKMINYASILLIFKIRIDYISDCNIIEYNVSNFTNIVNICAGNGVVNKNTKIYSEILHCDVFDTNNSLVNLAIIFSSSLDI